MTRVNDHDLTLIHQSLPEFQRDQIETFVPLDIGITNASRMIVKTTRSACFIFIPLLRVSRVFQVPSYFKTDKRKFS